jgi:transcriptional regulator with XRE-family HTH domain
MTTPITPEEFDALYIARVKALRQLRGMTAGQMSTLLGVPAERYRKYETRTPMPHALMEHFALITGVSVEFLLTGRRVAGKGPYPDVPGPHMIEKWRAERIARSEKRQRKDD